MQKSIQDQLKNEYRKFGGLFRGAEIEGLTVKVSEVLDSILSKDKKGEGKLLSGKLKEAFMKHYKEIEIHIDFYDSPEPLNEEDFDEEDFEYDDFLKDLDSDVVSRDAEYNPNKDRINLEKRFSRKIKYFAEIKERCAHYKKEVERIGYSVESDSDHRNEYPLHPPNNFLTQNDIDALEKFLHWDTFLHFNETPGLRGIYLESLSVSKVGSNGLDIIAQSDNKVLMLTLLPILSGQDLSAKQIAIVIWAYQYFIAKIYNVRTAQPEEMFFPSLSSLIKDVYKHLEN